MPRVLGFVVVLCVAVLAPALGRADAAIFDRFDAGPLNASERRLLQTALAATDDYRGPLDGVWGPLSQTALDAYAHREFDVAAQNAHAAALVLGFLDEVGASGWDFRYLPELGVSLALPLDLLGAPEPEEGAERRWSHDGALTVLLLRHDRRSARLWHDAARRAGEGPVAPVAEREPARMVTRGALRDGRAFFTRSDLTPEGWGTVFVAADATAAGAMNLVAASVRPGPPLAWDLPEGGRLDLLVSATETYLDTVAGAAFAAEPMPTAVPLPAGAGAGAEMASTGTGFYLGPRTIVTAEHVVARCARIRLPGGGGLAVIAADPELDVAALATTAPARHWLTLADGGGLRLGQRVHAAGFPYYSIAGTSLNLTSGNVSALAGVDDDRRFFSFSAPVQPGNSGGPLVDSRGVVRGLVVARLSEDFIVETTGSLPQNVNYALRVAELAAFLDRAGVRAASGSLARFDMDAGAPDAFAEAVVPIVCE